MVLMNAAKAARHEAALIVRTNVCGAGKKAGLAPSVGWFMSSWRGQLPRAPQSMPLICVPNTTVQTQKTGYRATIGGNMG